MYSPELTQILKSIKIFAGMSEGHLNEIKPLLKPMQCTDNELVIREGDPGKAMYIIKSGAMKVTRSDEEDDEIFIGLLNAGSAFGEFSLIDDLPRSANVTTIEESELFQLDKKDFDQLLDRDSSLATIFYRNCLTETFARFRDALANITFSQHTLREKNAELEEINKDLSVAQQIQSVFINSEAIEQNRRIHERVRHEFIYHPCIEVGGDFMNIVRIGKDLLAVIIADVEGHGVTASLATGVLKSAFSLLIKTHGDRPSELMTMLNEHFCEVLSKKLFATSYYALIDLSADRIITAKAGHHHPLFWKARNRAFTPMEGSGVGLGILDDARYTQQEYAIEKGDRLIFFTDGIIEQFNPERMMYSHRRLKTLMGDLIIKSEKEISRKIFRDVIHFASGAPVEDDITLLMIEFTR